MAHTTASHLLIPLSRRTLHIAYILNIYTGISVGTLTQYLQIIINYMCLDDIQRLQIRTAR